MAVSPLLALSRPPDIHVTFTSRFNAPAYVADGSHCVHPRADLSAWKMFLIREKKKKNTRATNLSLLGGKSRAIFFFELLICVPAFAFQGTSITRSTR